MSSDIAEVVTSSCESAVDIIAAIAPEIRIPANHFGKNVVASRGMSFSASARVPGPISALPITPIKNAPKNAGMLHAIAMFLLILTFSGSLMDMYLITRWGWPVYPSPQLKPPMTPANAAHPAFPPNREEKEIFKGTSIAFRAVNPTIGSTTRVRIIIIACTKSVHATAKNPPISV